MSQQVSTKILKKVLTPKGKAAFAWLKKPDTGMGKPKYRITVIFDKADPEYKAFVKTLADEAKKVGMKTSDLPIKLADEKMAKASGVPVGSPYLQTDTLYDENDPKPVPVMDARAEPTTTTPWGGDIIRVAGALATWEMAGRTGLKVYLNAVQLLKSEGGGDRGSYGFEADEEFLTDEDTNEGNLDDESVGFSEEPDDDTDPTAGLL